MMPLKGRGKSPYGILQDIEREGMLEKCLNLMGRFQRPQQLQTEQMGKSSRQGACCIPVYEKFHKNSLEVLGAV